MQKDNDFLDLIYTRRSVLSFINKKVSKEKINQIIEAGLRAPSSKNSQPWFFLILQNEVKNKVCECVLENPNSITYKVPRLRKKQKARGSINSTKESLRIVQEASVLIIIFNKGPFTGGLKKMGKNPERDSMYNSELLAVGACMENMLLAARALSLGAVPIMDIYPAIPFIQKKFAMNHDFIISIAIGYPKIFRPKRKIKHKGFVNFLE